MTALNNIRLALFATELCFSFIILGIIASLMSFFSKGGDSYPAFSLGLATSSLSLFTILASLFLEMLRPGAFTSFVMVELGWVGLLCILWTSTAADIVDLGLFISCRWYDSELKSLCRQYQAVEGFSFLNGMMLFGWWVTLLTLSIGAASNGIKGVWATPVPEHPGWSKDATPPANQPVATNDPTVPPTDYGSPGPREPQPAYGTLPQQDRGIQLQQGFNSLQRHQSHRPPQPQVTFGAPAPDSPSPRSIVHDESICGSPPHSPTRSSPSGSPHGPPQQLECAGQAAQLYPAYLQPHLAATSSAAGQHFDDRTASS